MSFHIEFRNEKGAALMFASRLTLTNTRKHRKIWQAKRGAQRWLKARQSTLAWAKVQGLTPFISEENNASS